MNLFKIFILTLSFASFLIILSIWFGNPKMLAFIQFSKWFSFPKAQITSFYSEKDQPKITNDWFSSAYSLPSGNIFAYPGNYKFDKTGVTLGVPQVNGSANTIFGSFMSQCIVSDGNEIVSSKVLKYDDWSVTVLLNDKWTVNIMQGSPTAYISIPNPNGEIAINCETSTFSQVKDGYLVKRGEKELLFFQAFDSQDAKQDGKSLKMKSASGIYRVSVLPDEKEETLSLFTAQKWHQDRQAYISWQVQNGEIETTYEVKTIDNEPELLTLWPHHRLAGITESYSSLGTYQTLIGEMQLVSLNSFTTKTQSPELPFQFTKIENTEQVTEITQKLQKDVELYLNQDPPEGVYFAGTWFGALDSLIQLTDLYRMETEKNKLLEKLKASFLPRLDQFTYDSEKKMLIANKPEFGNEFGNDHHFHYGYYIRSAAILAHYAPELQVQMEPVITQMITDIANTDRASSQYPFLRSFSAYEGHSWADGSGNTGDGNNQESTSEALNAWYAVNIWGQVTKNTTLQDLGSWLFSQELAGTRSYWFADSNPMPTGFSHKMTSILWGGKRDFATWFSGQPMHIYGIQWLPITPASIYIAKISNLEEHISELESLDSNWLKHEWADLYLAVLSFSDAKRASKNVSKIKTTGGTKTHSLPYQMLYQNLEK